MARVYMNRLGKLNLCQRDDPIDLCHFATRAQAHLFNSSRILARSQIDHYLLISSVLGKLPKEVHLDWFERAEESSERWLTANEFGQWLVSRADALLYFSAKEQERQQRGEEAERVTARQFEDDEVGGSPCCRIQIRVRFCSSWIHPAG